ncbi:O-antigen ligase family protein [Aquiflexum gelatinilyticum]|uniref:O-antigen ligase-related domain-containing protein n=1 Tax=Aquiflexum gelatinilyticum TaxID=2961943 RepID=A0A9X2P2Z2_9BACT|nr:O-antigen ligase family protein [Aquiflexum gelatinilyticum]MCR9014771.1 hypothetical protein [Aquiflexum gelatinilyticum]
MKSNFWNNKVYIENFILVCLIVFKSTQASVLAIAPETTIIVLIYSGWIFYKRRIKIDQFILVLVGLYFALNLFYYISFGSNNFFLSFYILLKMLYAYITIKIVRESFFAIYEKLIYFLVLVSLPLFLFQLINYELLFKIVGVLQNNISILEYRNDRLANIFIFTLESNGSLTRNSGFAWEPKGFSNFLLIAILINLVSNRFSINKRLIVFYLAIVTTLSTTGFLVAFVIFPIFFVLNTKSKKIVFYFLFFSALAIYVLSLEIGYEKIKREIDGRDRYIELLEDTREFETRSLGRFPSFILDFNDFLKRPVFGYGFNREERTQSEYTKLVRVNGVSDILAVYGIVGFSIIFYFTYKSFSSYLKIYNSRGSYLILSMVGVIYFASALTSHPFWMIFYFLFSINLRSYNLKCLYELIIHEKSLNSIKLEFKERPETV